MIWQCDSGYRLESLYLGPIVRDTRLRLPCGGLAVEAVNKEGTIQAAAGSEAKLKRSTRRRTLPWVGQLDMNPTGRMVF